MANLNKDKRFHYTYKTTDIRTGEYYLGMHSTNNLEDEYLGSGKRLRRRIRKYGKENFKFEIIEMFCCRQDLVEAEKLLISEEVLLDTKCLNLKPGGSGGFTLEQARRGRANADKVLKGVHGENYRSEILKQFYNSLTPEQKVRHISKIKEGQAKSEKGSGPGFKGKTHSQLAKKKMSASKKGKGKGESNSQYGTYWITNGEVNQKIAKQSEVPNGWTAGRVFRK
jgi:hypothetical protein